MAIKIMDSFEPAGSGFKVVDAKDISVTENINHDLKYALTVIGYLLGLVDVENNDNVREYLNGYLAAHKNNNAISTCEINEKLEEKLGKLYSADYTGTLDSLLKNLASRIYGEQIDIYGTASNNDLSLKTLESDITKAKNEANGHTDMALALHSLDILKYIIGTTTVPDSDTNYLNTSIPEEYRAKSLYDLIENLKHEHSIISSITYFAGVYPYLPEISDNITGDTIYCQIELDEIYTFTLEPGVVIIVEDEKYITLLKYDDNNNESYIWHRFGTISEQDYRVFEIENILGSFNLDSVNNNTVWGNIANIYAILGLKTGDIVKDNNADSLQTIKKALTTSSLAREDNGSKKVRLTKNFGKHVVDPKTGYVDLELPTDAQSMTDFILSAFIEVLRPTVTNPSITVVQDMANENFEIGSSYTPKLTITFNPGKYLYGPDTGVMFSNYSYTFNSAVNSGDIILNTSVIKTLDSIMLTTLGDDVYKFTDISATYGDSGNNAYNNIGDEYEDNNGKIYISGSSTKNVSTPGINVYAPYYVKYYTEAIDNAILERLNDSENTDPYVINNAEKKKLHISGDNKYEDLPTEGITVTTNGMLSMLIAIPIGKIDSNKKLTICNAANQLVKQNPILAERLNVKISGGGTNDYIDEDGNATNYRIYYVNNDAPDSGVNTYTIKYE